MSLPHYTLCRPGGGHFTIAMDDTVCARLMTIPGIGPVMALA